MNTITGTEGTADSKGAQATGLAFAVGFFFSFRIILVLLSVRVLGTAPRAGAELSLVLDLLLLLLVCFHSLGYAQRTFGSMLRLPSIRWVLAFLVFSFCSLAWSATVSLPTSARLLVRDSRRCCHRCPAASCRISDRRISFADEGLRSERLLPGADRVDHARLSRISGLGMKSFSTPTRSATFAPQLFSWLNISAAAKQGDGVSLFSCWR